MGNKCQSLWNKLSTKMKKVSAKKRENEKGNVNVSQSSGTLDQNIESSVPSSKSEVKMGNKMSDMKNVAINESVRLKITSNEKRDVDVSENLENVDKDVGKNVGSSLSSSKEEMSDIKGKGLDVKEQLHWEKAIKDAEQSESTDEENDEGHSTSSPEAELGTPPRANRRGMLPETLLYQDHERSFFDSAEWALSKQGKYVHKSLAVLESLEPILKPIPRRQALRRHSSFAPADTSDESDASSKDASSSKQL